MNMRNVRLAVRTLSKTPFITAVAVLSLALGIGANAAIFSIFEQVVRRPLPVAEPRQLVNFASPGPKQGMVSCNQAGPCDEIFSYGMYRDLERAATPLAGIAAHRLFGTNVAFQGETVNGEGMLVSGSYFPLLGLRPALGRLLDARDDVNVGAHDVAVLGHAFWEARLGLRRDVIGEAIIVNGRPFTIVGVAPRGFAGTTLGAQPVVYVPLTMAGVVMPWFDGFENRRAYMFYVFGRLAPGATIEQAAAGLNAVYRPILEEVEAPLQTGMSEQTMAQFIGRRILLSDGRRGQSSLHEATGTPLRILFGAAGFVLLIACANIANLLLARGAGRATEMSVRLSLGARRAQIVRQLLTESIVLAAIGGAASLAVAHWTLSALAAMMPAEAATVLALGLDLRVALFAATLALATGVLFGMFPALHGTRTGLIAAIRAGAGQLTGHRAASRFRSSLVVAQIALSLTLLVTAGLFLRSLVEISRVDLGMRTDGVVTFAISPELSGYDLQRRQLLYEQLEDELSAIPGVTAVTSGIVPVLAGSNWSSSLSVEGFEAGPDTNTNASLSEISPAYFETLGITLLAGREFTRADAAGRPKVAVVNEAFVEKFGLGRHAIGRRFAIGGGSQLDIEIVGLVRDAKYSEVKGEVPPLFFTPWRQSERVGSLVYYVRGAADPAQLLRAIPAAVARLDADLPVENLKTLARQVDENIFLDRMIGTLAAAFAGLATLLAAIGLYGVLAYSVASRTREIGVRVAIGASGAAVRRMVLRQMAVLVVIGSVIGLAGALALGRVAASLLHGVGGADPVAIATALALLGALAFAAGVIPARRAARIDPLLALRAE
jgi:predicted permease